ncbi:N-acetyltransferase family protein [Humitalea sp. 24SJ18S-53]|uniref:GNAT family N-acetyltransferase n=1 Tax=Humitalea sp. 24SJ18S-53 TaxID=3422307 RepID=UPI003D66E701
MIAIRRARPEDAAGIAAVHVAAWRATYAGILPYQYLAGLDARRIAAGYMRDLMARRDGHAIFVATVAGVDRLAVGEADVGPQIIGFCSGGRARRHGVAEGEIETLYLLEDWQERGIGRRLLRAMAAHLAAIGCRSAMLWVLAENPTRFFYGHLHGRIVATDQVSVAGETKEQRAVLWDPIGLLLEATASTS